MEDPVLSFHQFRYYVESSRQPGELQRMRASLFNELRKRGTPLINEEGKAVFVCFAGSGGTSEEQMFLWCDINSWEKPISMQRVMESDIWFHEVQAEPDATFLYSFQRDGESVLRHDSLNPRRTMEWYSQAVFPDYQPSPYFKHLENGSKGSYEGLKHLRFQSEILGYPRDLHVYLPPGYDPTGKYPALYFSDGEDYIEFADVPSLLTSMIRDGSLEPVIAVFISPPNRGKELEPNRRTEYAMNDAYAEHVARELVPMIDDTFATNRSPLARCTIGPSFGGLISVYTGWKYPDVFGAVHAQSGYFGFKRDKVIDLISRSKAKPVRFFIDYGAYEWSVAPQWIPSPERNFTESNRSLIRVLKEKGIEVHAREVHAGHAWINWRDRLADTLPLLWGKGWT